MITRMRIRNFKSFGPDGDWFPLGRLTLILGANASGKSTILQSLLLLAQSWKQPLDFAELQPDGEYLQLGHASLLAHNRLGGVLSFGFERDEKDVVELKYELGGRPTGKLRAVRLSHAGASAHETSSWEWVLQTPEHASALLEFHLTTTVDRLGDLGNPLAQQLEVAWTDYITAAKEKFDLEESQRHELGIEEPEGDPRSFVAPVMSLRLLVEPEGLNFSLDYPGDSDAIHKIAVAIESPGFDHHRYETGAQTLLDEQGFKPEIVAAAHALNQQLQARVASLYALRDALAELAYVGPSRQPGQRLYVPRPLAADAARVGVDGRFTAAVLDSLGQDALSELNDSLSKQHVPYRVRIQRIQGAEQSAVLGLQLQVCRASRAAGSVDGWEPIWLDLCDVGYGVSQLLPIIVQLLAQRLRPSARREVLRPLLVEQPELHLHPAWQADVTSVLLDRWPDESRANANEESTALRVQSIVETHSETMVLRIRRLLRTGMIQVGDVQVLAVCRTTGSTATQVTAIEFKATGWFDREKFPGGFFPARLDEELG